MLLLVKKYRASENEDDFMKTAIERFLKYVSFDTESDEASVSCPSTAKQRVLAEQLRQELIELGAAQSLDSVPPAPALRRRIAFMLSYSPERRSFVDI